VAGHCLRCSSGCWVDQYSGLVGYALAFSNCAIEINILFTTVSCVNGSCVIAPADAQFPAISLVRPSMPVTCKYLPALATVQLVFPCRESGADVRIFLMCARSLRAACIHFCNFCHASFIHHAVREKVPDHVPSRCPIWHQHAVVKLVIVDHTHLPTA